MRKALTVIQVMHTKPMDIPQTAPFSYYYNNLKSKLRHFSLSSFKFTGRLTHGMSSPIANMAPNGPLSAPMAVTVAANKVPIFCAAKANPMHTTPNTHAIHIVIN